MDIDLTFLSSVTEEFIKQMVEPPIEQDQIMSHQTKLAKELKKQIAVNEGNFTSDTDSTSSSEEEVEATDNNDREAAFEAPLAVSHMKSNQQVRLLTSFFLSVMPWGRGDHSSNSPVNFFSSLGTTTSSMSRPLALLGVPL